jgi:hypothetical protein
LIGGGCSHSRLCGSWLPRANWATAARVGSAPSFKPGAIVRSRYGYQGHPTFQATARAAPTSGNVGALPRSGWMDHPSAIAHHRNRLLMAARRRWLSGPTTGLISEDCGATARSVVKQQSPRQVAVRRGPGQPVWHSGQRSVGQGRQRMNVPILSLKPGLVC